MLEFQRRLAEIALPVAERYGFVLADGYAIALHEFRRLTSVTGALRRCDGCRPSLRAGVAQGMGGGCACARARSGWGNGSEKLPHLLDM